MVCAPRQTHPRHRMWTRSGVAAGRATSDHGSGRGSGSSRGRLLPASTHTAPPLSRLLPGDNCLAYLSDKGKDSREPVPNQTTDMKPSLLPFTFAAGLICAFTVAADDAAALAGKWSAKKVNDEGQKYTQTVELKPDNKFSFQIIGEDDQVAFVAQGEFKLDKLGPFKTARFFHVKGGAPGSDLNDIDDEFQSVYALTEDAWILAANFDKDRQQKPALDVYQRVKSPAAQTLVIDEIEMADVPQ